MVGRRTLGERVLALCVLAPSGCWEWVGYRGQKGYGQLSVNGSTMQAHRASYIVFKDPNLPRELVVDHLCRNHGCVNPLHLDAASNEENQERGMTKTARSRMFDRTGRCRRGHDRSVYGRRRGNGYWRCTLCHAEDERARRQRRREEAS
jgi:hypothetical protein